jgi:hypothetical protein
LSRKTKVTLTRSHPIVELFHDRPQNGEDRIEEKPGRVRAKRTRQRINREVRT